MNLISRGLEAGTSNSWDEDPDIWKWVVDEWIGGWRWMGYISFSDFHGGLLFEMHKTKRNNIPFSVRLQNNDIIEKNVY